MNPRARTLSQLLARTLSRGTGIFLPEGLPRQESPEGQALKTRAVVARQWVVGARLPALG